MHFDGMFAKFRREVIANISNILEDKYDRVDSIIRGTMVVISIG